MTADFFKNGKNPDYIQTDFDDFGLRTNQTTRNGETGVVWTMKFEEAKKLVLWSCARILHCVVNRDDWAKASNKRSDDLFSVATMSDIGFVLLVMQNNYEKWSKRADFESRNVHMSKEEKKSQKGKFSSGNGLSSSEGQARSKEVNIHVMFIMNELRREKKVGEFTSQFWLAYDKLHSDGSEKEKASEGGAKQQKQAVVDELEDDYESAYLQFEWV